jgi:hypothetical protein
MTRASAVLRVCWAVSLVAWSLTLFLLMFGLFALMASDDEPGEEATNTLPALGVVAAVTAVLGLAFALVHRRVPSRGGEDRSAVGHASEAQRVRPAQIGRRHSHHPGRQLR